LMGYRFYEQFCQFHQYTQFLFPLCHIIISWQSKRVNTFRHLYLHICFGKNVASRLPKEHQHFSNGCSD
jgi:hypothetical protein